MKALIPIAIVLVSTIAAASQTSSAKLNTFLARNYPGWEIGESWRADLPALKAIESADLNGDGVKDHAIILRKDDRLYGLAILTVGRGFKAFNLVAQKGDDRWVAGVSIVEKGSEVYLGDPSQDNRRSLRLKTAGISFYDGEGMADVFYWQRDKFVVASGF